MSEGERLTPMMQQFREAKAAHPGMLVLFRNGDFYELFESDAELGHRVLGLTLTKRDKEIPMAGFPQHKLEHYLGLLLRAGHRVAVCEQMEVAGPGKKLIRREVNRVVTPGTVTEDELLDPSWITHDDMSDDKVLAGPLYRLHGRAGSSVVHVRSFVARCARLERDKREARRPELERRVWVSSDGTRTPFLDMQPDFFDFKPREIRFFQDWEESSARTSRVARNEVGKPVTTMVRLMRTVG